MVLDLDPSSLFKLVVILGKRVLCVFPQDIRLKESVNKLQFKTSGHIAISFLGTSSL